MKRLAAALALTLLGGALTGCAAPMAQRGSATRAVPVEIIAFNDFHGNLEAPKIALAMPDGQGGTVRVPAGGAAYLAGAIDRLRADHPNAVVVSAGDIISASPLTSALFLDEPTILAMNRIGVDFNAVGNHEFDRGRAELLRMQNGGCEKNGAREPCQIDRPFPGARFRFLAANVLTETGTTLFPAYGLRRFGSGRDAVTVGFIGMTLRGTPSVVTPAGVAGLHFADEANTVNALVPQLRREGADAIVVLIHQGSAQDGPFNPNGCNGLHAAVDVVVSGHTHQSYICDYAAPNRDRPLLVTSAGQYGTLVTAISLSIDPVAGHVLSRAARNIVIQGDSFTRGAETISPSANLPRFAADADVAAIVTRYASAAQASAARPAGRLSGPALRASGPQESVLGDLIADAQLAATRAPANGGAQIAFMNPGGVRADLQPASDGTLTYGQLFAVQPFANSLVVKTMTGAQLRALLEEQFEGGSVRLLSPSQGFRYRYDASRPAGQRILGLWLNDVPIDPAARYRVTMNSFLASGGDGFTQFAQGTDAQGGGQDVDALEAYLSAGANISPPALGRIVTP
jgi:5'-nucleotidase